MTFDVERYMSQPRSSEPVWVPATSAGAAIVPVEVSTPAGDVVTVIAPGVLGIAVEIAGRWWNAEGGLHSIGDGAVMVGIGVAGGVFAGMLSDSAPRAPVVFGSISLTPPPSSVVGYSGRLAPAALFGLLGPGRAYAN